MEVRDHLSLEALERIERKETDIRRSKRLLAAQGGQSHFRGGQTISQDNVLRAAKIGTVPCERLRAQRPMCGH